MEYFKLNLSKLFERLLSFDLNLNKIDLVAFTLILGPQNAYKKSAKRGYNYVFGPKGRSQNRLIPRTTQHRFLRAL